MSETDPHRTSATLELLTLLTGGAAAPATLPAGPPAPAPATGRLRPSADREQQLRHRSDLRERLTDGIVELRKRRQIATHRAAGPAGPANPADPETRLAAMARRAAERAGHPLT